MIDSEVTTYDANMKIVGNTELTSSIIGLIVSAQRHGGIEKLLMIV